MSTATTLECALCGVELKDTDCPQLYDGKPVHVLCAKLEKRNSVEPTAVEICGVTLKSPKSLPLKTIETRYIGATDYKGSRVMATDCGDHRIYGHYDNALSGHNAHWQVAARLANQLGWSGEMVCGATKNGYVFVFVN